MNQIIEAIDAKIQELDTRRTWLLVMRKMATEGPSPRMLDAVGLAPVAVEPPAAPPSLPAQAEGQVDGSDSSPSDEEPESEPAAPEPERPPRRRRRPAPRSSVPADRPAEIGPLGGQDRSEAQRNGKAKRGQERTAQFLALVRAKPGITGREAGDEVGIHETQAGRYLSQLASDGKIRLERDGARKRYFPNEADIAPPDDAGCKTAVERRLLAAVQNAPVPLTTVELAANAKVNISDAGPVLWGLQRRGIVRAIPTKTETSPQRWELPREMAEAA